MMAGGALPAAARGKEAGAIRLGGPSFSTATDPEEHGPGSSQAGLPRRLLPGGGSQGRDADPRHRAGLRQATTWSSPRWAAGSNLLDADPAKRAANLRTVTDGLALAEADRGAVLRRHRRLVPPHHLVRPGPEEPDLGVLRRRRGERPQDHRRRQAEAGEVLLRDDGLGLPDSPDSYLKMIKAVDRPAFAVHLDPCNLINSPQRFYHNTALLNECFDKLGPWIVSCHAKDLTWDVEMNVHFREVPHRHGQARLRDLPEAAGRPARRRAAHDRAHERPGRVRPLPRKRTGHGQ